jgi:hypothetical protein
MKISQSGAVTTITIDVSKTPEQWILLASDCHHDSVKCNMALEERHLKELKARDGMGFYFGDIFDAMQGRFDPRRSMAELRPEYRRDDYYDFVVKDIGDFFADYSPNIALISDGNHELAVLKSANTNLVDRLVGRINQQTGSRIVHGGYGGWVRFMIQRKGVPKGSIKLKYFHGAGGEAPVTRGVIQTNRQAVYLPDADIVVNGHSHNTYYIPISRERIGGKGTLFYDIQHHIRTPGYKNDYADGTGGWDVTRGGVPKPVGAVWCLIKWDSVTNRTMINVYPDVHGAEVCTPAGEFYTGKVYEQDASYP